MQIPFGKRALCTKMATDETADKDRRAYKVPIPGNKSVVVTYGYPLLLGVTQMADGYNFAVEADEDSEVYLLLYRKIPVPAESVEESTLGQRGKKIPIRCAAASGQEMVMTGGMRKHRKQTLEI